MAPAPVARRPRRRSRRRAPARRPHVRPRASGGAEPPPAVGGLRLPPPPVPTDQYVPAVAAGGLLFVSGQDPEAGGRLVYRGRVGGEVSRSQARAAIRLATLNGLAVAAAMLGSLAGARRCAVLACFVDAGDRPVEPSLAAGGLALVRRAFPGVPPPVLWLRPARGLAGGMPVEVELILELA